MSITDNSTVGVEPYSRQMTSYRRTRSAILEATKALIAARGVRAMSMIEIADSAQVSRATLYNHFRDKESVLGALLAYEIDQLFQTSRSLASISIAISSDGALATMRSTDPALLTQIVSQMQGHLWEEARMALSSLLGSPTRADLAMRWLIGQVFAPLQQAQSQEQALAI